MAMLNLLRVTATSPLLVSLAYGNPYQLFFQNCQKARETAVNHEKDRQPLGYFTPGSFLALYIILSAFESNCSMVQGLLLS